MGVSISGLTAGTTLGEDDVFEIEQVGVSKKITKNQLRKLLFSDPAFAVPAALPQNGDIVSYDGADFIAGAFPRWRVIHQNAYSEATPASSSTITFDGGAITAGIRLKATDYFVVGTPVRVEIGAGVFYYGICTIVTDSLLTISGAILPLSPIISLAVGDPSVLKHIEMTFPAVTYNASTTLVLRHCQHYWRGPTGYLVAFACSHVNTSAAVNVNLQMNGGANVSTAGVLPAAGTATTRGLFVANALGDLIAANVAISDKQLITVKTPVITGTADFLTVQMTFVVP